MKKWWKAYLLMIVLGIAMMQMACGKEEEKSGEEVYETLEEVDYEFLVFYDPSAKMLLQSFMEHHPEIEINMANMEDPWLDINDVNNGLNLKAMIKRYGLPDLILGGSGLHLYLGVNEVDKFDLPRCYEEGYIADIKTFCANDVNLDPDSYFPGTFEVFQDKDHLYALPLGISLDFMLTTESKYDESEFSKLKEGYTGIDLMQIMQNEVKKEREIDAFFCPERISARRLLYQLGGVTQTKAGIQVDEETFQQVYEYTYLNNKKVSETKETWAQTGKWFTTDNGFVQRTAFEPRAYEGKFEVSFWENMDAPAIALYYATTANQYHLDEGTKAIYIPNHDDGNAYTAAVRVYGAVGAESKKPELAYELLRMLMDEEISYFEIHDDGVPAGYQREPYNLYPVNKERALQILDDFEKRNALMLYGHQGEGRYFQILDIVPISEEEKAKHEKMLNGISDMVYFTYDMDDAFNRVFEYQDMGVEDYKECYDEVVKALNANLAK